MTANLCGISSRLTNRSLFSSTIFSHIIRIVDVNVDGNAVLDNVDNHHEERNDQTENKDAANLAKSCQNAHHEDKSQGRLNIIITDIGVIIVDVDDVPQNQGMQQNNPHHLIIGLLFFLSHAHNKCLLNNSKISVQSI